MMELPEDGREEKPNRISDESTSLTSPTQDEKVIIPETDCVCNYTIFPLIVYHNFYKLNLLCQFQKRFCLFPTNNTR